MEGKIIIIFIFYLFFLFDSPHVADWGIQSSSLRWNFNPIIYLFEFFLCLEVYYFRLDVAPYMSLRTFQLNIILKFWCKNYLNHSFTIFVDETTHLVTTCRKKTSGKNLESMTKQRKHVYHFEKMVEFMNQIRNWEVQVPSMTPCDLQGCLLKTCLIAWIF